MKSYLSWIIGLFLISPFLSAQEGHQDYIGHWRGVVCRGRLEQHKQIRFANMRKDLGHQVESFEFDVLPDGTVQGKGVAAYWFNASADVNLLLTQSSPESHLEGKIQNVKFAITGNISQSGLLLTSVASGKLKLINAGKSQDMDAWNVFGRQRGTIKKDGDATVIGWSGVVEGLGMQLEWKAIKEGLSIYEITTPSGDRSFISTDTIQFRAKVPGNPGMDKDIDWVSEDGKVDNTKSGALEPEWLKDSPDYPAQPPLKPNPPSAAAGRVGKLSYKVIASIGEGDQKQSVSIVIQQDDVDRIRQEYVDIKKNTVPARSEFTNSGGEFNTGDHVWAIVNSTMVEGYRQIAANYAPHPARINSAYRNPVRGYNIHPRGADESRHLYGDAVDIQTVSVGHSGRPNYKDWLILEAAALKARAVFIEKIDQSGVGHVHADWRPK